MSFEEDLKISPFNSIDPNETATRAPSIGRFAPNIAQTLIRRGYTIGKNVLVIRMHLVKIRKSVCFEHNRQAFVLYLS